MNKNETITPPDIYKIELVPAHGDIHVLMTLVRKDGGSTFYAFTLGFLEQCGCDFKTPMHEYQELIQHIKEIGIYAKKATDIKRLEFEMKHLNWRAEDRLAELEYMRSKDGGEQCQPDS